jgi:hypothetical protein
MRSYAEFLGLDGQLYVDEYNSRHIVEGFDDMPQRRPRVHQDRAIERKVVLLALAGIAAVTALVIVAWKFGGSGSPASTPPVVKPHKPAAKSGLRFTARGNGAYVRVWTKPWVGKPYVEETLQAGNTGFVPGKRFWVFVKHPAHIRFTLAGKPVTVYSGRNIVTSTKTTRVTG